jgi:hypothetical protein
MIWRKGDYFIIERNGLRSGNWLPCHGDLGNAPGEWICRGTLL